MKSKYIDLGNRAIDPNAFIKIAENNAQEQTDSESLEAKKTAKTADAESKKAKDDTLSDRTKIAKENILKLLKEEGVKPEPVKKTTDDSLGGTAAAIKLGMETDAVNDEIVEEIIGEPIIKVAHGLLNVDHEAMVEKVAGAPRLKFLGKLKTPALLTLGLGSAAGAGYVGGVQQGKKRLGRYVAADRRRDVAVTRKAYRYGQINAYNRMKNRLGQTEGAA